MVKVSGRVILVEAGEHNAQGNDKTESGPTVDESEREQIEGNSGSRDRLLELNQHYPCANTRYS